MSLDPVTDAERAELEELEKLYGTPHFLVVLDAFSHLIPDVAADLFHLRLDELRRRRRLIAH